MIILFALDSRIIIFVKIVNLIKLMIKLYQEIKEVKDQMRELADKLEALETVEEKIVSKTGDVVIADGNTILVCDEGLSVHLGGHNMGSGIICVKASAYNDQVRTGDHEHLGTFNEVYMLRSDVEKDYISRDWLRHQEKQRWEAWCKGRS